MSLFITSLNSGSNGNCYYVGNTQEAVLIDAGISCRETEKRMEKLGLKLENVKAIFISHEHSDHIRGVAVLSKKYKIPVYITPATCRSGKLDLLPHLVHTFEPYTQVEIGGLTVIPFPKIHDAADPHSFILAGNGVRIGVLTDIGACCERVVHHFSQCHAAFLEANYDAEMLENGRYPAHLKHRIRGGKGHLSNVEALEMFRTHKPDYMSHVLLSHLSADNNSPELVEALFREHAGETEVIIASRHVESAVYEIRNHLADNLYRAYLHPLLKMKKPKTVASIQLSLFD
jgi:phosphoribosyl 1,2-cyclic phosphodiesterase